MKVFKITLAVLLATVVLLLALIRLFPIAFLTLGYYLSPGIPGIKYEEYKEDFNKVKNFILDEYPDSEEKFFLSVSNDGDLSIRTPKSDVTFPEEITDILIKLLDEAQYDTGNLGYWSEIRLESGRIVFTDDTEGVYALIYSPDKKPTWIRKSDEKGNKVRKIGDGWYHVWLKGF